MSTTTDLRELRAQLLEQEIRQAKAEAELAELVLAQKADDEADRLARSGFNRTMNIFGPISSEFVDSAIIALDHWRRKNPTGPVEVNINSPGGSVVDGFALFDAIQRLKAGGAHVTTRATGMAASMGAILLQAGDHRVATKNSIVMIHELTGGAVGKRSDRQDQEKLMDELEDRGLEILSAPRSKMTAAQIKRKWRQKDWYLMPAEALKHGFVDAIES